MEKENSDESVKEIKLEHDLKNEEKKQNEYIFKEIKKDLINKNYNEEAITEIININRCNINNDIKSIQNETSLDYEKATLLYIENSYNAMNSIFKHLNIKDDNHIDKHKDIDKKDEIQKEVQKKINELRIIANDRDNYYEKIKK